MFLWRHSFLLGEFLDSLPRFESFAHFGFLSSSRISQSRPSIASKLAMIMPPSPNMAKITQRIKFMSFLLSFGVRTRFQLSDSLPRLVKFPLGILKFLRHQTPFVVTAFRTQNNYNNKQ